MTRRTKIRTRIAMADGNLRFDQVDGFLKSIGATSRQRGSHVVYLLADGGSLTIVKSHGDRMTVNARYIRNLDEQLQRVGL